jgi:hypothetical protein
MFGTAGIIGQGSCVTNTKPFQFDGDVTLTVDYRYYLSGLGGSYGVTLKNATGGPMWLIVNRTPNTSAGLVTGTVTWSGHITAGTYIEFASNGPGSTGCSGSGTFQYRNFNLY